MDQVGERDAQVLDRGVGDPRSVAARGGWSCGFHFAPGFACGASADGNFCGRACADHCVAGAAADHATIVGICSGVKTLSAAGLLTGRKATGHWYDIEDLRQANPSMRWVRDRRYVADRGVVTTTGVTASVPVSLALVEAIGGRARARELADALGASSWDARHDTERFALDRQHVWTAIGNKLAFWKHEVIGIPVEDGVDEIALALAADAYARTYRSSAATISEGMAPVNTAGGLRLLPDSGTRTADREIDLVGLGEERPVQALESALDDIAEWYGGATARFVALQLEYARAE